MSITIVDSPHSEECYFCKALKTYPKPKCIAVHNNTDDEDEMSYQVETIIKFCPKCGKRLVCENDYNELWVKQYKDYFRSPFNIDSDYVTEDLIKALNRAKREHFKKIEEKLVRQKLNETIWNSIDYKEEQ